MILYTGWLLYITVYCYYYATSQQHIIVVEANHIPYHHNDSVVGVHTSSSSSSSGSGSGSGNDRSVQQQQQHQQHHHNVQQECATTDATYEEIQDSKRMIQTWMTNTKGEGDVLHRRTINIVAYVHIIYTGYIGRISNEQIQEQFLVLNNAFRPYNFTFIIMNITRTENVQWYYASINSLEEKEMFRTLRVGNASTLNIFWNNANEYAGYARYPFSYIYDPVLDGVVIRNQGKTLIHEVGHWLGLYHTFQRRAVPTQLRFLYNITQRLGLQLINCYLNDDSVKDTPQQGSPTSSSTSCLTMKDTCPLSSGLDPIQNYMDYSNDSCRTEFTIHQVDRMHAMWYTYRNTNASTT